MRLGIKDSGSLVSLIVINALGKAHKIFSISSYYVAIGFFSRNTYKPIKTGLTGYLSFFKKRWISNRRIESDFVKEIVSIVKKHNLDALLPLSESDIIPLARHSKKIKTKLLLPEYDEIILLHNKVKFIQEFSGKFPMPLSFFPTSFSDVIYATKKLQFPIILKPAFTPWNLETVKCQNLEEAIRIFKKMKKENRPIIQEFIDGFPIVSDVICDATKKPRVFVTYSIPFARWSNKKISVKEVQKGIKSSEKISKKIFKKLKWQGTASIQFLVRNKKPQIMEINPRSSAMGVSYFVLPYFPNYMVESFFEKIPRVKKTVIITPKILKSLDNYLFYKETKSLKFTPLSMYFFKLKKNIY